jgi:hypothetical protein
MSKTGAVWVQTHAEVWVDTEWVPPSTKRWSGQAEVAGRTPSHDRPVVGRTPAHYRPSRPDELAVGMAGDKE